MNQGWIPFAGILVAVILALDAFVHAYWATGQTWPARTKLSLVQAVLNISNPHAFKPAFLVPLAVLLWLGAVIMVVRVFQPEILGQLIPDAWLQLAVVVLALGFLLRGVAGIGWIIGLMPTRCRLFYRLNLLVYTPVCLILFLAAVAVASS